MGHGGNPKFGGFMSWKIHLHMDDFVGHETLVVTNHYLQNLLLDPMGIMIYCPIGMGKCYVFMFAMKHRKHGNFISG